jgi:hypothetical protein
MATMKFSQANRLRKFYCILLLWKLQNWPTVCVVIISSLIFNDP